MNISLRRTATTAATLGLLTVGALAAAVPASAAEGDSDCGISEVCLYWGSDRSGAVATFYSDNANHGNYRFAGPSGASGVGENVENNVASVQNRAMIMDVDIFTERNYSGISQTIVPGDWENLVSGIRNQNSSHWFD